MPSGEEQRQAPTEAGWPAVERFVRHALGILPPGQQPPPTPHVLTEWETTIGPVAMSGLLYGVTDQWGKERKLRGAWLPSLHLRVQRLFRITDAALRNSLPLTALGAVFLAVEAAAALHRGRERLVVDSLYGGATVAAIYAASTAATARTWPPPPLLPPTVLVMGMCFVQGVLQSTYAAQKAAKAEEEAEAELERQRVERAPSRHDAASVLLAQLEAARQGGPGGGRQQQDGADGTAQGQQQPEPRGETGRSLDSVTADQQADTQANGSWWGRLGR